MPSAGLTSISSCAALTAPFGLPLVPSSEPRLLARIGVTYASNSVAACFADRFAAGAVAGLMTLLAGATLLAVAVTSKGWSPNGRFGGRLVAPPLGAKVTGCMGIVAPPPPPELAGMGIAPPPPELVGCMGIVSP